MYQSYERVETVLADDPYDIQSMRACFEIAEAALQAVSARFPESVEETSAEWHSCTSNCHIADLLLLLLLV